MMTTMTTRPAGVTMTLLGALALPAAALAQSPEDPRGVGLHVGNDFESCYFDLHSELTASQFREFAAEGGQIARFRQVAAADTLGAGRFSIELGYAMFFLDDTKGAWNNTMSHPEADHYLGRQLAFPMLAVRAGVTDTIDAEVFGTVNPMSNYGFGGLAAKIRVLDENAGAPVSVALRPSASALLGPTEVQAYNLSGDLSVSRRFHGFAPFAGVTVSSTLAVDSSSDTEVGDQIAVRPAGFAGVDYRWRFITVGAEAEISSLPAFALRAGGQF